MDRILNWLKSGAPYISLGVIVIAILLWKFVIRRLIENGSKKFGGGSTGLVKSVVKALAIAVVVVIVCEVHGVNVSALVTGFGVASVIVGLALQDTLADVFMGLHIVSDRFFKDGDGVIYKGEEGIVSETTLRTTKIRRLSDGSTIVLCNRQVSEITRLSDMVNVNVPMPYLDDVAPLRSAMKKIEARVGELPDVSACVFKGTQQFDSSTTYYRLAFYCRPAKRHELTRKVNGIVQDVLFEEGISIPFNQLDVHMK